MPGLLSADQVAPVPREKSALQKLYERMTTKEAMDTYRWYQPVALFVASTLLFQLKGDIFSI